MHDEVNTGEMRKSLLAYQRLAQQGITFEQLRKSIASHEGITRHQAGRAIELFAALTGVKCQREQ